MSNHKCEICGEYFETKRGKGVHIGATHKNNTKKEYTCANCNEKFSDYESRREAKDSDDYFCSRKCKDENQKNGEYFDCNWCGEEVYKSQSSIDEMGKYNIENHFCDKNCEQSWKRNNWVGEEHPCWQGGEIEYGDNWSRRRRMTLERDNHTCQHCGITQEEYEEIYGRQLDVHHISPIRSIENKNKANSLQNLVTLCIICHKKLEKYKPVVQEKTLG